MGQQTKEMLLKSVSEFTLHSHFALRTDNTYINCSNLQREEGGWGGISLERVRGSCDFCDVTLACEDESLCKQTTCLCLLFSLRDVEMSLYSSGHGAADNSRQKKCSSNLYLNLRFIHILPSGPTTPTINSSNLQTSFFKTSTQNGGQRRRQIRRGWSGRRRRLDGV